MKEMHPLCLQVLMLGAALLLLQLPWASGQEKGLVSPVLFTWENVGQVTQISGKLFVLRRRLRLTESSWSLEPGAVAKITELEKGNKIFAQGKTLPDGTFDVKRLYRVAFDPRRQPVSDQAQQARSSDFGGPEGSRPPAVWQQPGTPSGKGGGNVPGQQSPVPPSGRPGDAAPGSPGGLQDPRGSRLTRFNPWDADGMIEEIGAGWMEITQSYFTDSHTELYSETKSPLRLKELKVGMRVAVTVKDDVDEKSRAIKAQVIRLLPE